MYCYKDSINSLKPKLLHGNYRSLEKEEEKLAHLQVIVTRRLKITMKYLPWLPKRILAILTTNWETKLL